VRQRAIEVLAEYGAAAKLALPELIGLLGDNQSAERLHVIRALAAIGPEAKAALPKIKENLKNPDLFCRVAAAHALWRIDRNAELAIPVLIEAFADQQMDTEWLSEVLGEIGPDAKAAVPRLREIADSAPWAQASVRKALAKITGEAEPKDEPGVRK
jgi:HEAT repeat protein